MNRKDFLTWSAMSFLATCRTLYYKDLPKTNSPKKIIIIGAGMAGISAAHFLKAFGHEVEILEARDRFGGRIWTDREASYPIDLGAAWIHGTNQNPLIELADKFSVNTKVTDFEDSLVLDNSTAISKLTLYFAFQKFESCMKEGEKILEETNRNLSLRELLDLVYKKKELSAFEKKLFVLFERGLENENAAELDKASAIGYFSESETITGPDLLVYDGYDKILKGLLGNIKIYFKEVVKKIQYDKKGVNIYTENNSFQSELAVVTVPVGVLQKKKIIFEPSLPKEKEEAISKIPFGVFNKTILEFEEDFWNNDQTSFFQLDNINKQRQDLILNLEPVYKKPILAFLYSGEKAKSLEKEKNSWKEIESELKSIFRKDIPKPKRTIHTNWFSDPFSYGSYTYSARNMNELTTEYSKPLGRLFFAGEGTHKEFYSYVHGAYLSGLREAERINQL